jgi:hypothetical protein
MLLLGGAGGSCVLWRGLPASFLLTAGLIAHTMPVAMGFAINRRGSILSCS